MKKIACLQKLTMVIPIAFGLSCGDDRPLVWVQPNLKNVLSIDSPLTNGIVIWRSQAGTLSLKDTFSAGVVKANARQNILVMVTLLPGSRLTSELATDPLTLAYKAPTRARAGFALVQVPNKDMLDGLAGAAHASRGQSGEPSGLACGRVEILKLTESKEAQAITPAAFAETVPLPGVQDLLALADKSRLSASIKTLEDMGTREHSTDTGIQATAKTRSLFTDAVAGTDLTLEFEEVAHDDYYPTKQKSLIASIPGADDDATAIIFGAHLDSINAKGSTFPAPGADDNASGIATLVEITRLIAHNHLRFGRRIEFHSYATEEKGLIGSGDIATRYAEKGRKVAAMLQLDMDSYSGKEGDSTIYLVENDTSPTLRRSLKDLLNTYLGGQFAELSLAAGTSDHRSWTRNGFSAVFPFEHPQNYNHALHTEKDTSATINNMDLSERFAKLGLAFAAHYAGLESAKTTYTEGFAKLKSELNHDLKVAVVKGSIEGTYTFGVATTSDVKSIEVCTVITAGSMDCNHERLKAPSDSNNGDRYFYNSASALVLAGGEHLALFGYDSDDKLVALRTVKVSPK